jgi:rhamnosyltransferase
MRLSLVMPTWNGGPLLAEVLAAIDSQPGAADVQKLAIDSGSTDGTQDLLRAHGFTVHSIPQAEFDHGATRDLLIERTWGEVVLLLTQDATPQGGWLERLVACYEDPRVGAAYCRQVPRPGCNPILAQRVAEWTAGRDRPVVQEVAGEAAFAALEPLARLRISAYDNVAGSVRRTVWEKLRFGNRRFGEDIAFGKRVVLAGHRIVYEPRSAVVHSHDRSAQAEGQRIYCDHENLEELFGLRTIPDAAARDAAVAWGRDHFGKLVAGLDLSPDRRAELHAWAMEYAWWSAWGQYLGGNARRLRAGIHGPWFESLDRWLRAGI